MKKYLFGLLAVLISFISFSFMIKENTTVHPKFTDHFFEIVDQGLPLNGASYVEVTFTVFNAHLCAGTLRVCKIRASTSPLPTNLQDINHDNIPDVGGVITAVWTRN